MAIALVKPAAQLPAIINPDASPWETATDSQRQTAELRLLLIGPAVKLVERGASINHVAELVAARLQGGKNVHQRQMLAQLEKVPSLPTLKRWISALRQHGKAGLLPQQTGRVRREYGWEARAIALYNIPGKSTPAAVAWKLRREGYDNATESRVSRYLKSLPATFGEFSPARVGKHLHRLRHKGFQPRTTENLRVGECYAGDGHTVDAYVAHPNTGGLYRPELTAFIDVRSRYCVGWWLSESESGYSTGFALAHAMRTHNHVPSWLYLDRGPGWRARMLNDETVGLFKRFDIEVMAALPGNPHGKGWIERWFRTVRDHHDKFYDDGQAYCGDDMAPEINRRLHVDIKSGKRKVRSLADYTASLTAFIDAYNNEPMDVLNGRTPAQVWAELVVVPVVFDTHAILRPREVCTVGRLAVRFHKREYRHDALAEYDRQQVVVEYDLHDDRRVWVRDMQGRFICEAALVNKIDVIPQSRLEEQRQKSHKAKQKRLAAKLDELDARQADTITLDNQLNGLRQLQPPVQEPAGESFVLDLSQPADRAATKRFEIDITDWNKKQ